MCRLVVTFLAAGLLMDVGCSRRAAPGSPVLAPAALPAHSTTPAGGRAASRASDAASGDLEWNRDDPDYVAIRTAFSRARAALVEERYADFYRLIHPDSRLDLLDGVAFRTLHETAPPEIAANRERVFLAHRLPTAVRIDPGSRVSTAEQLRAAYSGVDDPAGAFADLASLSAGARIGLAFNVGKPGDPRIIEAPSDRATVYVCRPGAPAGQEAPRVVFRKSGGRWWLALD